MRTPTLIVLGILLLVCASTAFAGSLTPPGVVGSTMRTLQELYDSIAGTFDSTAIVADENGSLVEHLKYIEENMAVGSGVATNSLDFDDFSNTMTLDADTSIASAGFFFSTSANVGIGTTTPSQRLEIRGTRFVYQEIESITSGSVNEAGLFLRRGQSSTGYAQLHFSTSSASQDDWAIGTRTGGVNFNIFNPAINQDAILINRSNNNVLMGTVGGGLSKLGVAGNMAVGTYYLMAAPTNGIIVSGNVGIGISAPLRPLHVASLADAELLRLSDSDGTCDHNPESGTETVTCTSDRSLKSNIQNAPSALQYLNDFRIRQYTVKSSGDRITGVIAQELQETHPELVSAVSSGLLTVQQPNIWLLVKAIQELQGRVDTEDFPEDTPRPVPPPSGSVPDIILIASGSLPPINIKVIASDSDALLPEIIINLFASNSVTLPVITVVASNSTVPLFPETGGKSFIAESVSSFLSRITDAFKDKLGIVFGRGSIKADSIEGMKVKTDKLCIDNTCITENELRNLLRLTK